VGRTRTHTATGLVLDAGALIALERGDKRMIALLQRALIQGRTFRVAAGVVGQVWRDGRVQAILSRFLSSEAVQIVPLNEQLARACGELCRVANSVDVIDASVVVLARERREPIVTSDPDDLRRLDPTAQIICI
jgi:predicted nucleic acid-binding protein